MAVEPEYVLEPLRVGADFTLFRGIERGKQMPILAVAGAAENPSSQSIRRLEHEHSLANELDAAWAVRPLELTRHQGRALLVLEDPGGEPLDRVIAQHHGRPIDLTRFLRIAIGLAVSLGAAHRQGLIHKDVKPANALVDDSGRAWLFGFGVASKLPQERQVPAPPEIIAGTLAYMAPEQTGRMNRTIDSRSDLYSLGVTLYEMLTGTLPFAADDPLEWVHCHIARQPVAPIERREVPEPLSTIVMRLLAKNAEERYQTAAGLEADLRRCLTEWQLHGRIDLFTLGADDFSDRLLIPQKLYGREREVAALIEAFDRVAGQGTTELVLISGYSGVGKSSVVNELHKVLIPPRGLFAAGKSDQYKRDVPYATLAQAFQALVHQILVKSEAEVDHWRSALLEALSPNGRLMVNLIPELEFVIGKQPPVAELTPREARSRFQVVLQNFLGVFARPEHPLALFLDDLQWLDAGTLDLIEDLLTRSDLQHLILIGAYRDNEVAQTHRLRRKLVAIKAAGGKVEEITLGPLGRQHLGQLIADALRISPQHALPLVELVHQKTGGNPFFISQFLHLLEDEGLLVFDHAEVRWSWDLDRIRTERYTDNVVDLMVAKLNRLPAETQAALRQLACVGSSAEFSLLGAACQTLQEELHESLWEAVRSGLVVRSESVYAFQHDRVQEAAYSLIAVDARAEAHLRIGRLLLAETPPDKREEIIFEIVGQFNQSLGLIASLDERELLARLNLIAGKRAKNAIAYSSALTHFAAGLELLAQDRRTLQDSLTFELEFRRAECEFLTGDLVSAEERLSALSSGEVNLIDLAAVTCLRIDLYQVLGRSDRAVDVCLEYLHHVGVEWSPHPTDEDVRQEYERIWQRVGSRSVEELIDLPLMSDAGTRATMDVLSKVMPSTQCTDGRLTCLIITHMVNLSLEYGNSNASCCGYVWFGLILCSYFENYPAALRFGQLSLDLVDRRGLDTFKARVYEAFGIYVSPWAQDLRTGRTFVQRAFDEAIRIGDLTYATYCCNNIVTNSLAYGEPLPQVEREAREGIDFALKADFSLIVDIIRGQLCLIRALRGLTNTINSFDEREFDERVFEEHLEADPNLAIGACWYWIRKLQARVFAQDYPSALEAAAKAQTLLWTSPAFFEQAEYHFFAALARAASMDKEALAAHLRQIQIWAQHCPENFENRAALVGAELARIEGRDVDAMRLYEQAIRSAHEQDFVQNEGLAYEVAARFYQARGFETFADAYLYKARECYLRWGADGKVAQLDGLYPHLAAQERQRPAGILGTAAAHLDVASVTQASQALSSEIVLPNLIERLMTIVLQNAGAERGLLILVRDGEPRIEAEAIAGLGETEFAARQGAVTPSDLPPSVLQYVMRTQERVLLDDASADHVYSRDEYVQLKRSRSVLCLPLVKQAKVVGALYLENNLTPGSFTPDRVTVLTLLASQAAISLENAALYSDLRRSEAFLAHGQKLSHTGTFGRNAFGEKLYWSEESYEIYELDRSVEPTLGWVIQRIHPEDRVRVQQTIESAILEKIGFDIEYRFLTERGSLKHLHVVVRAQESASGEFELVGAITDISERRRAEEALRQALDDLARINRVTTMGELTASLAHEVSQPISGAIINANVALRMLEDSKPNLDEVRAAVARIERDVLRAAEIISRTRSQFEKSALNREVIDANQNILATVTLLRSEAARYRITVRTELATDLPQILGDRIQLQQVVMNLIINGIEAMKDVEGNRELLIRTERADNEQILVSVCDTGPGFPPQLAEQIFDPFFTTKPRGTGMGLRISRSIIESHGGSLWTVASPGRGAAFYFSLPSVIRA